MQRFNPKKAFPAQKPRERLVSPPATSGQPGHLVTSREMGPGTQNPDGFGASLEGSLVALQEALRQSLAAVNVAKPGPTAIGKRLGLDKTIAWKIGRITKARTPLEALQYVPGDQGTRIVLEAFSRAGCSKPLQRELSQAFDELGSNIATHAGDRATARAMARATLEPDTPAPIDEGLRRDYFRAASQIWGAQAKVQLKVDFIAPSEIPGSLDSAGFEGFVELLRLRPDTTWRIARKRVIMETLPSHSTFEPLDPDCPQDVAPTLAKYCTRPLPELAVSDDAEGFRNFELQPGRVGKTGATTCLIATRCRSAIHTNDPEEENSVLAAAHLRTPSELLVLDLFVHKDIVLTAEPDPHFYGQLKMGPTFPETGKDQQLPMASRVEKLRGHAGSLSLLEFPSYSSAVADAVAMAAQSFDPKIWRLEDFQCYRLRLTYPPIPSVAGISAWYEYPGLSAGS